MKAILCVNNDYALGNNNDLIYRIKGDLKHFKETTKGNYMLMGRKTHDSMGGKALPERIHLVLSRDHIKADTDTVKYITEEELPYWQELAHSEGKDIYVVGGLTIYNKYLPECTELYLTKVKDSGKPADTVINPNLFEPFTEVCSEVTELDPISGLSYIKGHYKK